ncbi:MAG: acyl-CoA dehydrogenase [Actinobacteria bacterium]|nr:acyl-CoA dehydrogenase [Actinomycetota bacterium]
MLTDEERDVQVSVRRLMEDKCKPNIAVHFEEGTFPTDLIDDLAALGLLGMHLTGYGCAESNSVSYGLACLELEAADSGLRSFVSVQGSLAMYSIWRFGSDEQKAMYLPQMAQGSLIGCFALTEPDHGSDPGGMTTKAIRKNGRWTLNGTKMWITNGGLADVATVWARTEDGIQGFLLPMDHPGVKVHDISRKLSLRASVTSEIVFDDCELRDEFVLPGAKGLRAALSCLDEARFGIVWGALGAARDSFECALAYAGSRTQFGRPIASFQLTQKKLVEMAIELNKGLLLALHLGRLKDKGRLTPEQISLGKLTNVAQSLKICREARSILGASGITLEYPVMRHMNNLESVVTYEGTHEMHTLVVGKGLTGIGAFA